MAQVVALNWMAERSVSKVTTLGAVQTRPEVEGSGPVFVADEDGLPLYYVFNLRPSGFVIIAADDLVYPILGYSFEGLYNKANHPPAFDERMEGRKREIVAAIRGALKPSHETTALWSRYSVAPNTFTPQATVHALDVGPLTATVWGQATHSTNSQGTAYGSDLTVTTLPSATLPNLAPYQPDGWSAPIVVSNVTGTTTDSGPLLPTDTLYLDWAAINNGTGSVPASPSYYFDLYLDGSFWASWTATFQWDPTLWAFANDAPLGSLSAGVHTLRLVCDATDVVRESDETDNEYTKTIIVGAPAKFFPLTPCRLVDSRHGPNDVKEPGNITPSGFPRGSYNDGDIRSYDL
ncbi:MAG: Spi family protease inhibitor, partial [Thermoanaerobaculales bacterium]